MSYQNILLDEPNLNRTHLVIILPIGDMFSKPIQHGVLNHSILIKGLSHLINHKHMNNYFCFTELTLNNLNLKSINIIGDYVFLKKLVLHHNSIKDLSVLNNLNELEYLDVSHNCLECILKFTSPKLLIHVDYSNNNIEHLDNLSNYWTLVYLDLSYNVIKHVSGLSGLKYLKFLNLSHNYVKQIRYSLPNNLVEIDLSYNDLEEIQLDMSLSMCEVLNISHNKIKLFNFLKNATQLSVLNIQNNMIDDVLQIEYLKTLKNLQILKVENNEFLKINVHNQILLNNLPLHLIIDQKFIKTEDLKEQDKMEMYSMLTANKNAIKSTVLEHLSGRPPIRGNKCGLNSVTSLPMVILVGPPKTRRKYFLNQIFMKHADKFYQAFIYTTNNACMNKIYKKITLQDFNKMNSLGEFLFSYRFFGHFYGLAEDELYKCINENKVLISFTNLEGALSLQLKGYNPIFVLLLPEDKLFYKTNIYQSMEKHMNSKLNEKKTTSQKKPKEQILKAIYGISIGTNFVEDFNSVSLAACPLNTNKYTDDEKKTISQHNYNLNGDFHDLTDNNPCTIFYNECLNNLNICHNLYEYNTDIFHSLIYVDNFRNALNEIITIMIDTYNKYQNNQISKIQKQPNKHTLKHLKTRIEQLYNELID